MRYRFTFRDDYRTGDGITPGASERVIESKGYVLGGYIGGRNAYCQFFLEDGNYLTIDIYVNEETAEDWCENWGVEW